MANQHTQGQGKAKVNKEVRDEVRNHLGRIQQNLSKSLEEAKVIHDKMATFEHDDVLRLGLETVEKSIEYGRAIIADADKQWGTMATR